MPFIPDPNNPGGPFIEITQAEYDVWVRNVVSRNSAVNQQQAQELQEVAPPSETPSIAQLDTSPGNVGYTSVYDPETGQYAVVNQDTGLAINSGLTEQQALLQAQEQTFIDAGETLTPERNPFVETEGGLYVLPEDIPEQQAEDQDLVPLNDPQPLSSINASPNPVTNDINAVLASAGATAGGFTGPIFDTQATDASITQAFRDQARQQQALAAQRRNLNNGDWRVRLRLAPGADYLYKAANPGILQPLKISDGIIFPYTPKIDTAYKAEYDAYALTHSNYKGYFYKSSYVDAINLQCTFTAQSTFEANYLLAVITFFKAATKMFYGQDSQRGAPPPLVYLSGLGEYQFNKHPCVINQFNYNLPSDADYIRAGSPNQLGVDQVNQRDRASVTTGSVFGGLNRLAAALLTKGALPQVPPPPSFTSNAPSYVPTKMDITISLLPVQSRQQVSKQFSVRDFANGNLIKGGFW